MTAPISKVRGERDPHVCGTFRNRAMDKRILAIESPWKQRGILVFRLHHKTVSVKGSEVFRAGHGHARTGSTISGISDEVLALFGNVGDPRVFYPPQLL